MITVKHRGSFKKIEQVIQNSKKSDAMRILDECGRKGVQALMQATPRDTGKTASSWDYEVVRDHSGYRIYWTNTNQNESGTPIVILLQYGHGTNGGTFVQGHDFINPAIAPIMQEIADSTWEEITK